MRYTLKQIRCRPWTLSPGRGCSTRFNLANK